MITSEQVAQLAGVSRATVSRVLNGSSNVSDETKKRIYAAIATLGYNANIFTRASSQGPSPLIAL
ncbi:MAG: LacI family DNA-binding transcriptional regulator, partial [Chloroflexi bacterium]|nr:LacI family DNA-binding transcriptional regulator [Chloroflexota bacterium]